MGIVQLGENKIVPGTNPWGYGAAKTDRTWTPAAISTALWLDAADSDTITLVSGKVSQLADKSGNSKHATQSSSSARPVVSTLNNNSVLQFDGSDDYMQIAYSAAPSVTIFYVQNTSDSSYILLTNADGATGFGLVAENGSSATTIISNFGTPSIFCDGSPISWTTRDNVHDGLSGATRMVCCNNANLSTWVNTRLSGYTLSTERLFAGKIAEVIFVTGAISNGVQQKAEGYLAHKWGLTANLPADHPYKTSPPVV